MLNEVYIKGLELGGTTFSAHKCLRDYAPYADGIVFMINAADRERFLEAKNISRYYHVMLLWSTSVALY